MLTKTKLDVNNFIYFVCFSIYNISMKRFLLKTMGCKSNQLEGALVEENLINSGYKKADKIIDADFFILNSCTVTHKSDNEAFQILNHAKKQNPNIITILTGCIAQVEKDKLLENPSIDLVLGNDEKLEISKYLNQYIQDHNTKCYAENLEELNTFHSVLLSDTSKTRASLKIQDGCDNRCSYCIIPFARGKNRSADLEFILNQIEIYEKAGFKEIMLTGIHIGQWGKEAAKTKEDNESKQNLLYLLQNIEEKTKIERFRLGSLNPLEINDEMLEFLKNSEKFCPHFHLSLQSMCDKTLKSMNRHYSVEKALDLIEKIYNIFPLGFIGSDVIAGFAGETEEDFLTTIENIKKSKLTQIHTFPYSIRKGTAAEKFDCHLDSKVKESRASVIKEVCAQKYAEFLQKNIGSVQEILIEKNVDKKSGMLKGISRNYLNVLLDFPVDENLKNTIQKVKIKSINPIIGSFLE